MSMHLPTPKGSAHPAARFRTPAELEAVQRELEGEEKSLRQMAKEIGCSHATLSKLKRGVSYRER